jgi:hypothetical protein
MAGASAVQIGSGVHFRGISIFKKVSDEIGEFDRLIAGDFATEQEFYDSLSGNDAGDQIVYDAVPELMPRTPQPRNRKVSIYDLVKALQKALEVKRRRLFNKAPPEIQMPEKNRDITLVIRDVYGKIVDYFTTSAELERNPLMISNIMGEKPSREDVVYTILPLLQLSFERKIELYQQARFGDIEILYPGTKRMEEIKLEEEKAYKEWLARELEKEKKHNDKLKKLRHTLKKKKEEKEMQEKEQADEEPKTIGRKKGMKQSEQFTDNESYSTNNNSSTIHECK